MKMLLIITTSHVISLTCLWSSLLLNPVNELGLIIVRDCSCYVSIYFNILNIIFVESKSRNNLH